MVDFEAADAVSPFTRNRPLKSTSLLFIGKLSEKLSGVLLARAKLSLFVTAKINFPENTCSRASGGRANFSVFILIKRLSTFPSSLRLKENSSSLRSVGTS